MQLPTQDWASQNIIFALIFMLSNKLQTIGDSFFTEVSTKQWFTLLMLGIMKDYSPTLTELADTVGSSHQNVKQLVLKLEQKGFVEIAKDKADARRLRIKLTAQSQTFFQEYHHKNLEFMNRLFGSFKPENLEITKDVMLSMRTILEEMEKEYVKN